MKKNVKTILALLSILVMLCSCITSVSPTLDSEKTDHNELSVDRGSVYQITGNKDLSVIAKSANIENNEGAIIISLGNLSKKDITFNDSSVEVFGGNIDTGKWESIGYWSADQYYDKAERKARSQEFWTAFAGAMSIVSSAMGSYSSSNVYTPYGTARVYTHTYNPTDVLVSSLLANSAIRDVKNINKTNLDWLKNNLLYSTKIKQLQEYMGVMFFDVSDYPDYKIVINNDKEPVELVFKRSDRAEIINPWLDRSHDRHTIAFNYGYPSNNVGLMYFWSQPKGVGVYTGITLRGIGSNRPDDVGYIYNNDTPRIDYSFRHVLENKHGGSISNDQFIANGDVSRFSMTYPLGMTIKLFPYTWMLVGANMEINFSNYISGTYKYQINGHMYEYPETIWLESMNTFAISPQIGLNFITNSLDFYFIGAYDFFNKNACFDIGVGYAF